MKSKILAGLVSGVVMLLSGMVFGQLYDSIFPAVEAEYAGSGIFRPWNEPLMSLYFIVPVFTGFIFAWLWGFVYEKLRGRSRAENGLFFGYMYWLIGLPGMMMSYSSFNISFAMVAGWTLGNLFSSLLGGLVLALIFRYHTRKGVAPGVKTS